MNRPILIGAVLAIVVLLGAVLFINNQNNSQQAPQSQPTQPQPTETEPTVVTSPTVKEEMVTVKILNSGFEPKSVTVKVGTKVVWGNESGKTANVNSAVHPTHQVYPQLNLGNFENGEQVSLVFDKEGTYKYHNHLEPGKTGTVVVEE